jgi:hypothetical protein
MLRSPQIVTKIYRDQVSLLYFCNQLIPLFRKSGILEAENK